MIIGSFTLRSLGRKVATQGNTPSGHASVGRGALYELAGANDLRLTLRDTTWANGERDVVACERNDSPELFDTLIKRLRLAVLDHDGPYVELRQARLRPNGRANLFYPDSADLDRGAGLAVHTTLLAHGASQVGTREELFDDEGPARFRLGARFSDHDSLVPVVAYVLTRVCPVAAGLSA